jgi:hypothetical protein
MQLTSLRHGEPFTWSPQHDVGFGEEKSEWLVEWI